MLNKNGDSQLALFGWSDVGSLSFLKSYVSCVFLMSRWFDVRASHNSFPLVPFEASLLGPIFGGARGNAARKRRGIGAL